MNDNSGEILLYGYIKEGEVTSIDFVNQLSLLQKSHSNIKIRINSGGGSIFDGLTIFRAIKNCPSVVDTYIDGVAASMGSVIALAGRKCYMSRSAMFMTHKASGALQGTADEIRNYADLLERLEEIICETYAEKTGLTLAAAKAKYLTGQDRWLTSQQALSEGIIDGIYDSPQNIHLPKNLSNIPQLVGFYNSYLPGTSTVFTQSKIVGDNSANELLNEALKDDIVSSELYMQLVTDFKNKPGNLSSVIETLYQNKISLAYSNLGWKELDKAGVLEMIKRKDFVLFKKKFREQFNTEYTKK